MYKGGASVRRVRSNRRHVTVVADGSGVHPKGETVLILNTFRSLHYRRRAQHFIQESKAAGEAETSSAGEHLVEEYPVETHSGDRPGT